MLSPNAKIGKLPLFSSLRYVKQMFSFWGFWIFCSQFVPFAVFVFSIQLCISYLQTISMFSRRRSWFQRTTEASGVHGHTWTLYHLGSMCRRWSNPWFHNSVLRPRSFVVSYRSGCFPHYCYCPHLPEAEEGSSYQEREAWGIHLFMLA